MAEPYLITLRSSANFNGATPIPLTRADFTATGQRQYTANVQGDGIIGADFFGLFAPQSPKQVGVAFSSFNPYSIVRVIDSTGRMRQEANLTGDYQYLLLHGGDRLAVLTKETLGQTAPIELFLVVNELSESDHMQWALAHPPTPIHTRLRIIRTDGPFAGTVTGTWIPLFQWDENSSVLTVQDNMSNSPIPIHALAPFPRRFGALLSIRFSGSNSDGKLTLVESLSRKKWEAQATMEDVRWSRVQYAAHDDMLLLSAGPNPAGGPLVCDIEVVRVEPGDRLRGRYSAAEGTTGHNL